MPNAENSLYAVLTGDIVGSTGLAAGELQALFDAIRSHIADASRQVPVRLAGTFSVVQGDRWQLTLSPPRYAARFMILIAAAARSRGVTTRISLGTGGADRIVAANITESTGEAFTLSGRGLALLEAAVYKKHDWIIDGKDISAYQKLLFDFLGIQAAAWTRGQAEAILLAIQGCSQETIGENLHVKRQNAGKRLNAAHWSFFRRVIELEESIQHPKEGAF